MDRRTEDRSSRAETIARELHARPETALEEHRAAAACSDTLSGWGFAVSTGTADLPTAFVADAILGTGKGPVVGLIVEYDALPDVGHGCGHHLVASAMLAAAGALVDEPLNGRLVVLGSPAEEIGVGKVRMLDAEAFEGIDAVIAYHPSDQEAVWGRNNGAALSRIEFRGRPSHASSRPWDGRSAQDPVEIALHALALERLYHRDGSRIHAIVEEVEGSHNVLAGRARMRVNVRAPDVEWLESLRDRAEAIANGAAMTTATDVTIVHESYLLPYRMDLALARLAWRVMGLPEGTRYDFGGSSDLGNVSHAIPTVCITTNGWTPTTWHARELHDATGTAGAYESMHRAGRYVSGIARELFQRGVP